MWNDGWHDGSGIGWLAMALMMLVFWGGLIWLAVTMTRHNLGAHHPGPAPPLPSRSSPDWPSMISPSTGTFSPARTCTTSPATTVSMGISIIEPSRSTEAVRARRPMRRRIASPVPAVARASNSRPRRISVMITPTASKYTSRTSTGCLQSLTDPGGKPLSACSIDHASSSGPRSNDSGGVHGTLRPGADQDPQALADAIWSTVVCT